MVTPTHGGRVAEYRPGVTQTDAERNEQELRELATAAKAGDTAALDEILRRVYPLVMRRTSRFLPCVQDAEEACQDAMTSIARKIGSYAGTGSFSGWVTVIASNSARQTYRSLKRRSVEHTIEELPEAQDPRTTSVIAGSRIDLLEAIDKMEQTNPTLVEAFVLRDLGSLPYEEIAEQLGVPLGTVKARIHDARAVMRRHLVEKFA
jgi:RNA polymerase sigma factor (sigma-70 family)